MRLDFLSQLDHQLVDTQLLLIGLVILLLNYRGLLLQRDVLACGCHAHAALHEHLSELIQIYHSITVGIELFEDILRLLLINRIVQSFQQTEELLALQCCRFRVLELIEQLLHIDVLRVDLYSEVIDKVSCSCCKLLVFINKVAKARIEDWMRIDLQPAQPI